MAALFFVKYTKKGMSIDERDGKCTWLVYLYEHLFRRGGGMRQEVDVRNRWL